MRQIPAVVAFSICFHSPPNEFQNISKLGTSNTNNASNFSSSSTASSSNITISSSNSRLLNHSSAGYQDPSQPVLPYFPLRRTRLLSPFTRLHLPNQCPPQFLPLCTRALRQMCRPRECLANTGGRRGSGHKPRALAHSLSCFVDLRC